MKRVSLFTSLHLKAMRRNQRDVRDAARSVVVDHINAMTREFEANGAPEVDAESWLLRLTEEMDPVLGRVMFEGALAQLAIAEKSTTSSEAIEHYDPPDIIATELPQWLVASVQAELRATFAEPYWAAINEKTRSDVQQTIADGIEQGWSTRRIVTELRSMRAGYSLARATAIARTETGRARNSGHQTGIQGLQSEAGFEIGKQWVSINAQTTRPEHAALDGETTPSAEGLFTLAGLQVPYPQHRSLPASQSINCFCTIISTLK